MNLINEVPSVFNFYKKSITFESKEEKIQIIESIAERISSIYITFLTADWHANRDKSLVFFDFPKAFPPIEKVEKFKVNLKNEIVKELNKGDEDYDDVNLSTDYGPEKLLATVLKESDVSSQDYQLYKLFPVKTLTRIQTWNQLKKIEIRMTC